MRVALSGRSPATRRRHGRVTPAPPVRLPPHAPDTRRRVPGSRAAGSCGQRPPPLRAGGGRPDGPALLSRLVVPEGAGYFRRLLELQDEAEVAYDRIVSLSVDPPEVTAAFRAGLGARWTFLCDPERRALAQLGLRETTDTSHDPYVPAVFTLSPGPAHPRRLRRLLVLGARRRSRSCARTCARSSARSAPTGRRRPDELGLARARRRAPGGRGRRGARAHARRASRPACSPPGARRAKPVADARRADARMVDPEGAAARISLVLPPRACGCRSTTSRCSRRAATCWRRALRRRHDAAQRRLALRGLADRRARRRRRAARRRPVRAHLPGARCCTSAPACSAACRGPRAR